MNNKIEVLKFGGTSVGSKEAIQKTCEIVCNLQNKKAVIVVSAFCGVTDRLSEICRLLTNQRYEKAINVYKELYSLHTERCIEMNIPDSIPFINEIFEHQFQLVEAVRTLNEISKKTKDSILSCGELLSSKIIAEYYNKSIGFTNWLDSREIISTNSNFTIADVDYEKSKKLCKNIITNLLASETKFIVCGGFIGSDSEGFTTTIGRGGSDHTAAVIAMGTDSEILKIYTDVTGIKTTDPRLISTARTIKQLRYDEAYELAECGAKVLHPKTILPALIAGIPVLVLNTNEPNSEGTKITTNSKNSGIPAAIAIKNSLIDIYLTVEKPGLEILKKVSNIIDNYNLEIETLSFTKNDIRITLNNNLFINELKEELENYGKVQVSHPVTALTMVGYGIGNENKLIAEIFSIIDTGFGNLIRYNINNNSIKLILPTENSLPLVEILHNRIILKNVNFE